MGGGGEMGRGGEMRGGGEVGRWEEVEVVRRWRW